MKMLKSKNIRRICVLFAMLAPVIYLFGSLFSALGGAHGQQIFADGENVSYNYKLGVIKDTWINSEGVFYRNGGSVVSDYLEIDDDLGYIQTDQTVDWVYYFDSERVFINRVSVSSNSFRLSTSSGAYAIFGRFVGFVGDYFVLNYPDVTSLPSISAASYSDYVFKNFFAKDNFLVQWGENAISETPFGFAPFGAFWRYLDTNVLHLSNVQIGLMGYGYMYYCCHVLLFDIAFILVTFFLDFIQKVNDKVVGGVD